MASLQVVTDSAIHLPVDKRMIETVVPSTYTTKSGALNKARALQYCLGMLHIFFAAKKTQNYI